MSALEILKQDVGKNKKETPKKEKPKEEKTLTGSISISYSINPKTGKYTFLFSINDITEAISTDSFKEGIDHIMEMINAKSFESLQQKNKSNKQNKQNTKEKPNAESKINTLFDF